MPRFLGARILLLSAAAFQILIAIIWNILFHTQNDYEKSYISSTQSIYVSKLKNACWRASERSARVPYIYLETSCAQGEANYATVLPRERRW